MSKKWLHFGITPALKATEKVLVEKSNSGAHTKQLKKYGYISRVQPLMDFIRSIDDFKRARKKVFCENR